MVNKVDSLPGLIPSLHCQLALHAYIKTTSIGDWEQSKSLSAVIQCLQRIVLYCMSGVSCNFTPDQHFVHILKASLVAIVCLFTCVNLDSLIETSTSWTPSCKPLVDKWVSKL